MPVSTWVNDKCDPTCVLLDHEHAWLTKPKSFVFYRMAGLHEAAALERGVASDLVFLRQDCNAQVFLRVRNGLCKSPQTPRKIKVYVGC